MWKTINSRVKKKSSKTIYVKSFNEFFLLFCYNFCIGEFMEHRKISLGLNIKYGVMQALYWMGFVATYNYAAYYLSDKGFNSSDIGLILAFANIFAALLQPPIAAYADRALKSKLKSIIWILSLANLVLTVLILVIKGHPYLTAIFLMLIISFILTLHSFINSFAMEYANKGIQLNFTITRAVGSLGAALSSLGMGFIASRFGPEAVPLTYLVMFILIVAVVISFKPADKFGTLSDVEKPAYIPPTGALKFLWKYKKFAGLLLGATLIFSSYNMVINFMINIVERLGYGTAEMGTALAIAGFLEVPGMALYIILVKKRKCSTLLQLSSVFFTLKTLAVFLSGNIYHVYAAHITQLLSFAIFVPASVYYINNLMPANDKIKGQAYMTTTITLGGVIGSLLGGTLIDALSVPSMLLIATITSALGTLFMIIFTEKEKVTC